MPRIVQGDHSGQGKKFGIVVSRFYESISNNLLDGAVGALTKHGVADDAPLQDPRIRPRRHPHRGPAGAAAGARRHAGFLAERDRWARKARRAPGGFPTKETACCCWRTTPARPERSPRRERRWRGIGGQIYWPDSSRERGGARSGGCGPARTRPCPIVSSMLTDAEADEIRAGVESGLRGPVVIKWIRELLEDRDERLGRPKYEAPKVTGQALRRPRRRPR